MATPTPAAVYIRMSTDKQENSPERQRRQCEQFCATHGYEVVREYSDLGRSGTESKRRTEFQRMLADAKKGLFKAIVVSEHSRLTREEPSEQQKLFWTLQEAGVRVVSCTDGVFDIKSLSGGIIALVTAHKSHDESRRIAERVTTGLRLSLSRKGRRHGGPRSNFGFDLQVRNEEGVVVKRVSFRQSFRKPPGWSTALVLSADNHAVEAVRYAFKAVEGGQSFTAVARWFNDRNILTACGKLFDGTSILRMLRNPVYVGVARHGFYARGQFARVLPDGQIDVWENAHPAIVSREQFDRVQEVLKARSRTCRRRAKPGRYLLAGLVYCTCGRKMSAGNFAGSGARRPMFFYTCQKKLRADNDCGQTSIKSTWIEDAVLRVVKEKVLSQANEDRIKADVAAARERPGGPSPEQQRLAELREEIELSERNLARAKTEDDFGAVSRQLAVMREEQERLRAKVRAAAEGTAGLSADAKGTLHEFALLRDKLQHLSRVELAEKLRLIIRRVEVRREAIGEIYRVQGLRQPAGIRPVFGWSALIHFAPEWYPDPVPLTDEQIRSGLKVFEVVNYIRNQGGRPVRVRELQAAFPDRHCGSLAELVSRAVVMKLLVRLPGLRTNAQGYVPA
jgi:site-specific DNA recombinase